MMTTIRRQAASCLYGLAPLIKDILGRRISDLKDEEADETYALLDAGAAAGFAEEIANIVEQAEKLNDTEDPKLKALQRVIRDKQSLENNKLMVFSSFRHTLTYLMGAISRSEVRVGMVHGGTPDEERLRLRERFKRSPVQSDALDVLLFSEVGCEGLDYQFCDCIVNYDLPWNPMRVEQRIGRIDRKGQKSEKVVIYNLITPGTVDADIYERCLLRIGVFNRALGSGEEILGDIVREIRSVAEDIQLSEADRQQKLQQIADNQIRLIQEQQGLEERQAELFGIRLPLHQTQSEIEGASSFWLSPMALQNLVTSYLQRQGEEEKDHILGEKASKTLRVSRATRESLLKDFQQLPRTASPMHRQWETWLKGADPHLSITFDAQEAVEQQETAFITPVHPLARQAAKVLVPTGTKPLSVFQACYQDLPPGRYPFAIYEWWYRGVREDLLLHPFAESSEVSNTCLSCSNTHAPGTFQPGKCRARRFSTGLRPLTTINGPLLATVTGSRTNCWRTTGERASKAAIEPALSMLERTTGEGF